MNRNRGNRVYVCGWVGVVCVWKVRIRSACVVSCLSIDKVNLLQMDKLNNSVDVLQKPTLIKILKKVCHI